MHACYPSRFVRTGYARRYSMFIVHSNTIHDRAGSEGQQLEWIFMLRMS